MIALIGRHCQVCFETMEVYPIEIKINKEVRDYQESIFFGLSLRQFICSAMAIAVAVLLYFLLNARRFHPSTWFLCGGYAVVEELNVKTTK